MQESASVHIAEKYFTLSDPLKFNIGLV